MNFPEDLRYTESHQWARPEGGKVRVGITDFAQDELGEVVFVQLPEVGSRLEAGGVLGEVESNKAASEIYAPVSGRVVEANGELDDAPEKLNQDPYGAGWICLIDAEDDSELERLLNAEGYRAFIG